MTDSNNWTLLPFLRDSAGVDTMVTACGIRLDISRQRLTGEDLKRLVDHCRTRGVEEAHRRMMAGEIVNPSEGRAALHTSLRSFSAGAPKFAEVDRERRRMLDFARQVREGIRLGCRGDRITDVINVGIGGSEMGPRAVYHALRYVQPSIRLHFMSSADGVLFDRIVSGLNPFKTLVVVSSKSFGTRETMVNAAAVDQWLLDAGITGKDRNHHMVVVSAKRDAAEQMNLPEANLFPIWDWVGGRFSVWSSIGLPCAVALGPEVFRQLLAGAHAMDAHVADAPTEDNLALILALLSYRNAQEGVATHCFLPYDERLRTMVFWLQQLEMESLGKSTAIDGSRVACRTGQGVWGGHGNESQHSFYQWLREGTASSSVDLCWCEKPGHRHADLHRVLIANAKAQAEALVTRDPTDEFSNAVTTISIDELTPARLGALMALYEHKTTMLGTLFGINPFDQPGVELGKKLSRTAEAGIF